MKCSIKAYVLGMELDCANSREICFYYIILLGSDLAKKNKINLRLKQYHVKIKNTVARLCEH